MRNDNLKIEKEELNQEWYEEDKQVERIIDTLEMLLNKLFPCFLVLGIPYILYLLVQLFLFV